MYGGLCTPPILGDTQTQRSCFAYIYKAILHCKFAVDGRYNCKFAVLRVVINSGYNCKTVRTVKRILNGMYYPRQPGSLRPTFSPSIQ